MIWISLAASIMVMGSVLGLTWWWSNNMVEEKTDHAQTIGDVNTAVEVVDLRDFDDVENIVWRAEEIDFRLEIDGETIRIRRAIHE